MRFALVTDKKLIKRYKAKTSWFPNEASLSTAIVIRYDGEIEWLDMLNVDVAANFKPWVLRKSVKLVE